MKYLCLICAGKIMEQMPQADADEHYYEEYRELTSDVRKNGHFVDCNRLLPLSSAITIRVRKGKISSMDGPFVETKEQLGGYYVMEARDLNEATQVATKIPGASRGCVEIRTIAADPQTLNVLGLD